MASEASIRGLTMYDIDDDITTIVKFNLIANDESQPKEVRLIGMILAITYQTMSIGKAEELFIEMGLINDISDAYDKFIEAIENLQT